jgi:ATP-dependent DNA ligase
MQIVDQHENPKALLATVRARGGEGIVLKDMSKPYYEGWTKAKNIETHDCVITGFEMSTEGKYAKKNWIGAIKIGQYKNGKLVPVGKCSGMTDAFRKELSENKQKFIGHCIEIETQTRLPSGLFRHGRFNRMRHDKNPKDCAF